MLVYHKKNLKLNKIKQSQAHVIIHLCYSLNLMSEKTQTERKGIVKATSGCSFERGLKLTTYIGANTINLTSIVMTYVKKYFNLY